MDLNELAIFSQVVRAGGVSKAARLLNLPKSTVSRSIQRLEQRLKVRLLERSSRHTVPTLEGLNLYQSSAPMIAELEEAIRSAGRATTEPFGALRLTAPRDFEQFLVPIIIRYSTAYPDVRLEILLTDRIVDLVEEGYDMAIRGGLLPEGKYTARVLSSIDRIFVASPEYIQQHGAPKSPPSLLHHRCITTGESNAPSAWFAGSEKHALKIHGQIHVSTVTTARELALNHQGIAMLPAWIVAQDLKAKRLKAVLKDHCPPPGKLWLAYPSARHPPARVRAFVDQLLEVASKAPGWKTQLALD